MYKKHLAAGCMALMMLSMLPVSASAHCGGHRRAAAAPAPAAVSYEVCTTEDCTVAGRHVHDGVTYCGYAHADGICDGTCSALCTTEGCTLTGRHSHDGVTYCGYAHECGFCDGDCQQARTVARGSHHRHC